MDTALLKSFATAARTELIREVGARITTVLAAGSPERVEQPNAVAALERAIADAGGADRGRAHVVDKVAYTWFNRIVALRFMDANGYTGIGVVSPATDQVGQPEVLAAAKRGQLDTQVVKVVNATTVTGLLNGTRQPRPGVDAQAEAYALLLADYCRFWNSAMPFMFEREGDYTELLIPANLLAEDSVLSRSVTVLTEDVCRDVEVIGWLYQFYISERKDEVFAGFKKNKKAGADEIPAATQLFTPHWIVRYLVENSLGRLWMLNRPESRLLDHMDYYIAPVEETDFLRISKPEELTVIDPACGSGHMLTYAFDLLYAIYEEEGYAPLDIPSLILANNLYGTEIDPRAGALAAFALTMKAASKGRLFLKNPVEPSVCVLEPITFSPDELDHLVTKDGDRHAEEAFWNQFEHADLFGSLIKPDPQLVVRLSRHLETLDDGGDMYKADALDWAQSVIKQAQYLLPRYPIVVANPPYMGTRQMSEALRDDATWRYPNSSLDLCTMFLERAVSLTYYGGRIAFVVSESWAVNTTFRAFREDFLGQVRLHDVAWFDSSAFGVRLNTTGIAASRTSGDGTISYLRVRREDIEAAAVGGIPVPGSEIITTSMADLRSLPIDVLVFDLAPAARRLYRLYGVLGDHIRTRQGMATTDNARFVRYWWEVGAREVVRTAHRAPSKAAWVPYNKGGSPVRWYGNQQFLVRWKNNAAELRSVRPRSVVEDPHFFRPSVSWSNIGKGGAKFRSYPEGFVFDVAGMSAFGGTEEEHLALLGYLNSTLCVDTLEKLAPTLNYQIGDVARLPGLPEWSLEIVEVVRRLVAIVAKRETTSETAPQFLRPAVLLSSPMSEIASEAVAALEAREGEFAAEFAGLEERNENYWRRQASMPSISIRPDSAPVVVEWGVDLVSYAVGCMFGRYSLDEPGLILADHGATLEDYLAKVPIPTFAPDADNVIPVVDGDWFEDDVVGLFRRFLRAAFGDEHFEENLNLVTESLGVKNLRDYFMGRAGRSKFYDDHVQRYKKRPIYWLFSSPKGSFNALIYMHRYTPSTVSTVLTYLREYVTKLESALQQAERAGNAKEADRLRTILVELNEYEDETLYPKASENVAIDLDDGVRANYPKFGAALKKITGLEASGD